MSKTELVLVRLPAGMDPELIQSRLERLVAENSPCEDASPPVVCGVWREPSSFCGCSRTGDTSKGGFALGQRFGWWVHSACKKPTQAWLKGLGSALFHALGRNQLPNPPEEFRYEPKPSKEMLQHVGVQLRLG